MPESASERFARAVEGGPVESDLDESLRLELALVAALRDVGQSTRLDDVARQRMRRQLLAGLDDTRDPRAESVPPARARAAGVRGRLLVAAAAALCLLMSLSAMSLLMARDALPGDALYGVKRSAESAELGFTFGVESRGFKHLQFATARLDELEALATSGFGPTTDAGPYQKVLEEFDADAAAGSRLLVEAATTGDGNLLGALRVWAEQQAQRVHLAVPALPGQAAMRAAESGELLRRIAERAASLQVRLRCLAVTSGGVDDIGLLPAGGPCEPVNAAPAGSTLPDDPNRRPGDQPATSSRPNEQPPSSSPDPSASVPGMTGSTPEPTQPPPLMPVPQPQQQSQPSQLPQSPDPSTLVPPLPGLPGIPLG